MNDERLAEIRGRHGSPGRWVYASDRADIGDLLAEVERLRYLDAQFPCDGGCSPEWGVEETCTRHGRSPVDLWERIDRLIAENNRLRAVAEELERLRAQWEAENA